MQIDRQLTDLPDAARGGAVAIGNFDGVHRGHAALVKRLVERAKQIDGPAIVFTFDPHPVRLLRPEKCPPPLTWVERKAALLAELGVDRVIAYPTDDALLRLSAREFFDLIVRDALNARALVEGQNFFFGRDRGGDVALLGEFASDAGITLDVVAPSLAEDELISSSRIRRLLAAEGDAALAATMLTAPYRLRGIITHGAGRGAKLGFPTANVEGIDTLLPADGVYAGVAHSPGEQPWPAAVNIGPNPTFDEDERKVEAHLIGCSAPLYGKPLEIDFLERVRPVKQFASADDLADQIARDVERSRVVATKRIKEQG